MKALRLLLESLNDGKVSTPVYLESPPFKVVGLCCDVTLVLILPVVTPWISVGSACCNRQSCSIFDALEAGILGIDQFFLVVKVLGFGTTLTEEKLLIPIKPMPVVEAVTSNHAPLVQAVMLCLYSKVLWSRDQSLTIDENQG